MPGPEPTVSDSNIAAPGWPGIPPRWTSSAKSGVGTALNRNSRVWFTLSHGILNEIYYPRVDTACTRDMGLLVTDGRSYFSEEKRHCTFQVAPVEPGIPAFKLTNTEIAGNYKIEKEIFADSHSNVVIQKIKFVPLRGTLSDYHLYALLSPHLGNSGIHNTAWIGDYKGVPMLFAEHSGGFALACACSAPWLKMSAGFVGQSDGWQDLSRNFRLTQEYIHAEDGNVALTGEIDLAACGGEFVLALGFGGIWAEAGEQARAARLDDYGSLWKDYVSEWKNWQKMLMRLDRPAEHDRYGGSTGLLRRRDS